MRVWVLMDEGRPVAVTRNESIANRFYSTHREGDVFPFTLDHLDAAEMPQESVAPDPVEQKLDENEDAIRQLRERYGAVSRLLR